MVRIAGAGALASDSTEASCSAARARCDGTTPPSDPSNDELCQTSLHQWCRLKGESVAGTLTFPNRRNFQQLSERDSVATVGMFLRLLNSRLFANKVRRGRRLNCVVVREGSTRDFGKRLHYHLQLEPPEGMSASQLADLCQFVWRSLRKAGRQSRFETTRGDAWLGYILKLSDKPDGYLDSMIFELWRPPIG